MGDYTYEISIDEERYLVHLVLKGEVNKTDGEQVIIQTRAKSAETGFDILCDITEAEIAVRPADWFYLFRNKEVYPSNPNEKTAILISPKKRGFYSFVGNVARNLRIDIQIFIDEMDALDWLNKDK